MNPFDEALEAEAVAGGVRMRTHPEFMNMVGPFGGMTAAQVLHAAIVDPRCVGRPAAQTLNYTAPLAEGPFELRTRLVRTNGSNQHWTVEAVQTDAEGDESVPVTASRTPSTAGSTQRANQASSSPRSCSMAACRSGSSIRL